MEVNDNEDRFNVEQEDILLAKLITATLSSKFNGTPLELFVHTKYLMEIDNEDEIQDYIITDFNPDIGEQSAIKLAKDFISLKKEFIKPDKATAFVFNSLKIITFIISYIFIVPTLTTSMWIGGLIGGYFSLKSKGYDAFLDALDISAIDYNKHRTERQQADKGKWYYRMKWSSANHIGFEEMFKKENKWYLLAIFVVLCIDVLSIVLFFKLSAFYVIDNLINTILFITLVLLSYVTIGYLNHKMWDKKNGKRNSQDFNQKH